MNRDMNEVKNEAFQVMGTKNAKALMQEYAWQVLGNVRRPVWLKYGEQGDGEKTRSESEAVARP